MTMLSRLFLLTTCCAWLGLAGMMRAAEVSPRYVANRAPLIARPYSALPLGAVKPQGWLREQLQRMAAGMTGQLDELYPQVLGPRNGWLGGDGDGWERGPYWIDGLLPLAYLLDDERLQEKVRPWIEWTLANQREDGYLGPLPFDTEPPAEPGLQKSNRADWWPKMVMLKVLQNYHGATGDQRVLRALDRYFRYQLRQLPDTPLGHWTFWGERRGGDNLLVVLWLYNITGEEYLLDLARLIHQQTYPHTERWLQPDSPLTQVRGMHCVNIAQGMKHPLVTYQLDQDPRHQQAVRRAWADLDRHFGLPTGLYGADEPLNSNAPTVGSELCTAVEMMFSLETMLQITGEAWLADRLERIAFNVLPTQISDDFLTRQYFSLVNQVVCVRRDQPAHLTDHDGTDTVFGLLTGYPCCTTNLHQGWPKFTQHLWMASADKGLAALAYSPSTVTAQVGDGVEVSITETTDYPFADSIDFVIQTEQPVQFPLHLRIPGWCREATVAIDGQPQGSASGGQVVILSRQWRDGERLTLSLPMEVKQYRWHRGSVAIERGPLLYALRIGERWKEVQGSDKYGNYRECSPTDPWNYGLIEDHLENLDQRFRVDLRGHSDYPWSIDCAPIVVHATGHRLPAWLLMNQAAGPLPLSPVRVAELKPEPIQLIPYGCTTLRIAEFPVVRP